MRKEVIKKKITYKANNFIDSRLFYNCCYVIFLLFLFPPKLCDTIILFVLSLFSLF